MSDWAEERANAVLLVFMRDIVSRPSLGAVEDEGPNFGGECWRCAQCQAKVRPIEVEALAKHLLTHFSPPFAQLLRDLQRETIEACCKAQCSDCRKPQTVLAAAQRDKYGTFWHLPVSQGYAAHLCKARDIRRKFTPPSST